MQTTTNYGFNIVEGTDIVNPLTQLNPNFTALDTDLKAVSDATVDHATCIKTGTIHAVTRTNTDANVFRFTATGNWNTGDTMTVDGTLVSVYVSDGTAPANGCYVINTEVLASIQGTRVTLYVNSGDAANIAFDDTSVSYTANNVQTAIEAASTATGTEYASGVSVKSRLDNLVTYTTTTQSNTINANTHSWAGVTPPSDTNYNWHLISATPSEAVVIVAGYNDGGMLLRNVSSAAVTTTVFMNFIGVLKV